MIIIKDVRRSGKTSALVKRSAKTGYPILCSRIAMVAPIISAAEFMDVEIPTPLYSGMNLEDCCKKPERVLIDELDVYLSCITGAKVDSATITGSDSDPFFVTDVIGYEDLTKPAGEKAIDNLRDMAGGSYRPERARTSTVNSTSSSGNT